MNTPPQRTYAVKARMLLPMTGEKPARGKDLFGRLATIDNGMLLVHDGTIISRGKAHSMRLPAGCPVHDLGSVCLMPATVNAHAHVELSCLAGKTVLGHDFPTWLNSLIALLKRCRAGEFEVETAIDQACADLSSYGTLHVGNIAGAFPKALLHTERARTGQGLGMTHFCEWIGTAPADYTAEWPKATQEVLDQEPALLSNASPAGHALYSTDPLLLQRARQACRRLGRVFSFHLAESTEETEMLLDGSGPLNQVYRGTLLPKDWSPPHLRPLAYALKLNLLGPSTLAVHCVHLDSQELHVLALSATSVCLCPRSNLDLNVGLPEVNDFIDAQLLLCLGTDGLSSNRDLNVLNEAVFLRTTYDLSRDALLRMLTVNGAAALNLPKGAGHLDPNSPARFAILPAELRS